MIDEPEVYVDNYSTEDAEIGGLQAPYGDDTWRIIDENEGGVVAYAGSYDLAILIRDAIRKGYQTFKVGDHIRTLDTPAVRGYGLYPNARGVIVSVDGRRIGFLTDGEIANSNTYPWWAQPEHIELDK